MSSRIVTLPMPETDAAPDVDFRIAAGIHIGIVVAFALVTTAVAVGLGDGVALYLFAIAAFVGGTVVGGTTVGRWHGGPERLGRSWRRWTVLLPSAGFLVVAAAGVVAGPTSLGVVGGFAAVIATFSGGLVAMMARTRYVAAVCSPETRRVSWQAETAPKPRRRRLAAALVAFSLAPTGLVAEYALGVDGWWLFNFATIGGVFLGTAVRSATFSATAFGLEISAPGNRRLVPWRRFEGYRLTDAELRLERPWWLDYRCDRAEIDDIEAVTDALSDLLVDE